MTLDADAARQKRLCIFLSNGGSLGFWKEQGILSRELELYLTYIENGVFDHVAVFSYDASDHDLIDELRKQDPRAEKLILLTPEGEGRRKSLAGALTGLWNVYRHKSALAACDVLKTNQVSGAWCAALAHKLTGRPLMMRQGYSLSRRFRKNGQRFKAALANAIETTIYNMAAAIVVTSEDASQTLKGNARIAHKVKLVPTFVDMNTFTAKPDYAFTEPAIYVGRLEPQKNLINLVKACGAADIPLEMVGSGSQQQELLGTAAACGADLKLMGTIPNEDLTELLRSRTVFVLPSLHEGLPKVMIEAMACGMVCVGSPIPGTTDLIKDGENGYLSKGFDADELADVLSRAFTEKRSELGIAARAFVQDRFSLAAYARSEGQIFRDMAQGSKRP